GSPRDAADHRGHPREHHAHDVDGLDLSRAPRHGRGRARDRSHRALRGGRGVLVRQRLRDHADPLDRQVPGRRRQGRSDHGAADARVHGHRARRRRAVPGVADPDLSPGEGLVTPQFPGFRLPDELLALREQIRRVVRDEIIPVEQRIDPDAPELPDEDYQKIAAKTKAAGLWALGAPEKFGGGGLDTFSMCVALEEMSQHRMGLYNPGCGVFGRYPPPAIWAGNTQQIEKYAVPTIREGLKTFFAITEPSGGSDPAGAIQTRAEKRGD